MQRRTFLIGAPLALAACGTQPAVWAPDDLVARAAYRHPGPPMLTLFTMKNTGTGNGNHTGLMINASQRVIFDPAGTFSASTVPERNDLHYGITPRVEEFYISYHARETYFVLRQDIPVTAGAAEIAFERAKVAGPVAQAACTTSTARILQGVPGFEGIRSSFFPDSLARQFAALPGVREQEFRETDSDDKDIAAAAFEAEIRAD